MNRSIYDFKVQDINLTEHSLAEYKGKVLLIVNVASKCGFTPQYEGLEALYKKYKEQGLVVLGFPCNQFKEQEPGDEKEIASFCKLTYDVTFPLFAKIDVNGSGRHPLYDYLTDQAKGVLGTKDIKWNFTKFLVDRNGKVVDRFAPTTTPEAMETDVTKLLSKVS